MKLSMAFKTVTRTLFLVFSLLLMTGQASAQAVLIPSPPQIAGSSWVLMDPLSGRVIMEHNSNERLPPASLTKMMTAYIVERELDEGRIAMSDMVPISVKAWRTEGSRTFVQEGTSVSVEDLLKGVIIQSGNDASVALAEFVAGSEGAFVDIMNQQAQLLGMKDTHFENATGLPHQIISQPPTTLPCWHSILSRTTRKTTRCTQRSTSPITTFVSPTETACCGGMTALMV